MWLPSSFKNCPFCEAYNSYGITVYKPTFGMPLLIESCKLCRHSIKRPLCTLNKKVIYLDQFVVSDVSKENGHYDYKQIYEVLCKLYRQQIVICPYSLFHKIESLPDSRSNSFQKAYERLSNGVSFFDPILIYELEIIHKYLEFFGRGKALTIDDILYGSRNDWISNFICSIRLTNDNILNHNNEVEDLKRIKKNNYITLEKTFQDCVQNHDIKIDKKKYYKVMRDRIIDDLASTYLQDESFLHKLKNHYCLEIDSIKDFLREHIKPLPSIKIMAHLVASLAQQYVFGGRKSIPSSTFNDIHIVSSILPYCDAIFIDKKLYDLIRNYPDYQDYKGKLFSLHNKEDFLKYLKDLEEDVSTFDKELVAEIYPSRE